MIPSSLAGQIQSGLKDYIDTTFPITNLVFSDSLKKMLSERGKDIHEPYVVVRLPFRLAEGDDIITTDGMENASRKYSYEKVMKMESAFDSSDALAEIREDYADFEEAQACPEKRLRKDRMALSSGWKVMEPIICRREPGQMTAV